MIFPTTSRSIDRLSSAIACLATCACVEARSVGRVLTSPDRFARSGGYHNRLEGQIGYAYNQSDPFVGHQGAAFGVSYWLRPAIALGLRGVAFENADSDFNFQNRRATRVPVTIDEYRWESELVATYAFLHGRMWFLHFDAYASVGVGLMSTRAIPVIDPDHRNFADRISGSFGGGGGVRVFFCRWFAATFELRDFVFVRHPENPEIASNPYGPTTLADNVLFWIAASFFVPVP